MKNRITVREARATISKILASGKTVSIGPHYGDLRGFIVGIAKHDQYDKAQEKKALSEAKRAFTEAWIAEAQK
jgi:hypothetical protein